MKKIWTDKEIWPDNEIIAMLRVKDYDGFAAYFRRYYFSIKRFVLKSNGNIGEAELMLEQTLDVLLDQFQLPAFQLNESLNIYVFAISTNLWLGRLKEKYSITYADPSIYVQFLINFEIGLYDTRIQYSKKKLNKYYYRICKETSILWRAVFFDVKPIDAIIQQLKHTNKRSKKYEQIKSLEKALQIKESSLSFV